MYEVEGHNPQEKKKRKKGTKGKGNGMRINIE
jgi:hypothetical protein